MSESVVLCEGYHDRAFWGGLLEHVGCANLAHPPGKPREIAVLDPWGKRLTGGEYGYRSASGRFVRIFPCGGKKNVYREARNRLRDEQENVQQHAAETRLARLVVSVDPDVPAAGTTGETGFRREDLRAMLAQFDPAAAENAQGDFLLFGGATAVCLARWETSDPPRPGLPGRQTLERLACAAVVAAYPDRGPAVQNWLDSRPDAPEVGPKEFAWSYMAGWYAEWGSEAFFRAVWDDARVAAELEPRLRDAGTWRIAEAIAQ